MNYSIDQQTRVILSEKTPLKVDFDRIQSCESLSGLGINSIDFIKVAVEIEVVFGITISEDDLDLEKLDTIDDIVKFVTEQMSIRK